MIDFGGATHSSESHSSIINTRQYRCPEVLLQSCNWNESSDLWSIGCILVELATGDLLFPIHNDVDHIYMIDRLVARFPKWMTESCDSCYKKYFKPYGSINYQYADPEIKDWDAVMNTKSI
jgi:dual-specificity kinase